MIKKINSANSGVKRPFRVSDLQDIWTALNDFSASDVGSTPKILIGFEDKGDGNLSAGLIAMNGTVYYHQDEAVARIAIGANVYGHQLSGVDTRVFEDDTTQDYSFNMAATTSPTSVDFGLLTLDRIEDLRNTGGKKVIEGVLSFTIASGDISSLTFTPDKSYGENLSVTYTIDGNKLNISIYDVSGRKMSETFDIAKLGTDDMLDLYGDFPDGIFAGVSDNPEGIVFYWDAGIPSPPKRFSYRLKLYFDV